MQDRGFAHEDHTADLLVRAWGPSLEEAFAQAARGLVAYMVDLDRARVALTRRLAVEGGDRAMLLVRFVEEIRFLLETEGVVLHDFSVAFTEGGLVAVAGGEIYDAERHGHVHEIKAVTLHGAEIHAQPAMVRYLVDI